MFVSQILVKQKKALLLWSASSLFMSYFMGFFNEDIRDSFFALVGAINASSERLALPDS